MQETMMRANELKETIEESLLRNLRILVGAAALSWEGDGGINPVDVLRVTDVEAMLKACAANLAQVFAGRVTR